MNKYQFFVSVFLGMLLSSSSFADTNNMNTPAAAPAVATAPAPQPVFTQQQTSQIENIVRQYLVKNPNVLVEAMQALQQQQQEQMQKQAQAAIQTHLKELFSAANTPVAGNAQGTVNLVEFFDYQCGHCRKMAPVIAEIIKANPQLRVLFKQLPIFGGDSEFAAKAALASQKQGKFLAFHDALMHTQKQLNQENVLKIAARVGLDVQRLQADMQKDSVSQELRDNEQLAQVIGLAGTPAFILRSYTPAQDTANANGGAIPTTTQKQAYFIPGEVSQQTLQHLISGVNPNA